MISFLITSRLPQHLAIAMKNNFYKIVWWFVSSIFGVVLCYNLDARNVDILTSPQIGDYFGYSLILRSDGSVLVGAPKGNSTYKFGVDAPGVLYNCSFLNGNCAEHNINRFKLSEQIEDGALFTMAMDGGASPSDSVTVCAPKLINVQSGYSSSYFANGACRLLKDGGLIAPFGRDVDQIDVDPLPYYKYAFAELGMSVKYFKDQSNILFGAPGLYSWSGGLLRSKINRSGMAVSSKNAFGYLYDYFGYSLEIGKFTLSGEYWGVTGAPRAEGLLGKVVFFNTTTISMTMKTLNGDKIGSYFGATLLAVDVNANGIDDLFIGAPTYSINYYDEGCVYFYKSKGDGNFHEPLKLFGSQTMAARFGTAIADLGDINHDGFKDVAISAPYEQAGAVYIYLGNADGITEKYSQKIQPETFIPQTGIRGFGVSISKGVDVDGNSYNDVAVGAYTSSQVVLLRSQAIMEYGVRFVALKKEVLPKEQEEFQVQFCIRTISDVSNILPVETDLELVPDDRVSSDFYQGILNVTRDLYCLNVTLKLTNNIFGSTNPISLAMEYHQRPQRSTAFCSSCPVVNPSETSRTALEIPFAHGCGDDGVCSTQLHVEASFENINNLVLGSIESVPLKVEVTNEGEPAYLCQLLMVLPNEVNLVQVPTGCTLEAQRLKCLVGNNFIKGQKKEMTFDLDVSKIDSNLKSVNVFFNVSSVGVEITPEDNELNLNLPVVLDIKPQVIGKAFPDQATFVNDTESITIKHLFVISNLGKSPFDVQVTLAVPTRLDDVAIATIVDDEASKNNEASSSCVLSMEFENFAVGDYAPSWMVENGTEVVFCGKDGVECSVISCNVGHLASSSQVATVTLRVKVEPKVFEIFPGKEAIAFGTLALVDINGISVRNDTSTILFEVQKPEPIPLWIFIAASVGGLLIVLIIIIIMWKCNFFKRTYKEKLLSEENESAIYDSNEECNGK